MKIIRDKQLATLTLVPVEEKEEQIIASIVTISKPEDKLSYGGRGRDSDDENLCTVHLHAGGRKEQRVKTYGKTTVERIVHVDSIELILQGSTKEDKYEVARIRDMCFFGSGGLIFIGETEVNGKKAIVTTGLRCKHCGSGMICHSDCEWSTCDACAAKCEHNYVRGAIHGGDVDIGIGHFCDKCGRGKPKAKDEREMSVIEQHLAVERELGLSIIYKDQPPHTPRRVVEVSRLIRRHGRARQRNVSA